MGRGISRGMGRMGMGAREGVVGLHGTREARLIVSEGLVLVRIYRIGVVCVLDELLLLLLLLVVVEKGVVIVVVGVVAGSGVLIHLGGRVARRQTESHLGFLECA